MHSFFSLIVFYFKYIPFFHRSWRKFWIPLLQFLLNKYFVELQTTLPAFYIWSGVFVYMCVVVCVWSVYVCSYVCGVCMCVECVCVWLWLWSAYIFSTLVSKIMSFKFQ